MRRRELIAALGALALAPKRVAAQQGCCRTAVLLVPNPKVFTAFDLEGEFRKLGWDAGRNFRLLLRVSESRNEALPGLAADLAAQGPDVIIAAGDPAIRAARQYAPAVPVAGITDDMVGSGLVASMARPGGNTTGISILASELNVKRLQLLHEIVPRAARIGILIDPTTIATGPQLAAAAHGLGIELIIAQASDAEAILRALEQFTAAKVDAVNVLASPILDDQRDLIVERLNRARLPAMFQWPESCRAGGFAAYGPRLKVMIHALLEIADKLLRGARPADIPVQQPTKFELAINLKTAKALGVSVPRMLLAQADEIVE